MKCPYCAEEIQDQAKKCRYCGEWLDKTSEPEVSSKESQTLVGKSKLFIDKNQVLGLIGSAVLFIGVFTPIVSVPIMGNMNYFQNGRGDGVIILLLAVASFILAILKKYNKWLWITGGISLIVMAFTFINFQMSISQLRSSIQTEMPNNPFKGLGELAIQSVQLQWGWALLIVGAGFLIASGIIARQEEKSFVIDKKTQWHNTWWGVTLMIIIPIILLGTSVFVVKKIPDVLKSEKKEGTSAPRETNPHVDLSEIYSKGYGSGEMLGERHPAYMPDEVEKECKSYVSIYVENTPDSTSGKEYVKGCKDGFESVFRK